MTSRTLPNGETESFTYDALGNQTSHTDFLGRKTSYTVDLNGRVVFATDSAGNTTGYLYTASGQVASMSDSRGVTKYSYDAKDRLTRQDNPDGTYLAYSYDANGNITQRSTPAGTVAYVYDSLNRLVSVTDTTGKVTSYAYDANGNRIKTTLPNGTEADYSYDALNHLTRVEHRTTATQAVIRGYAYTLKPNGQRASVQQYDAAGTMTTRAYTYDSLNRLTGDVLTDSRTPANSSTTAYTYGDTGNRATKTVTQGGNTTTTVYTYDADDRLTTETTAAGTTTYTWDANGNLTQKVEPTQTTLYTWDSHNRLQSVARGTSAATATTVATYQYDANGNRVSKTLADGTKITYLVDSNMAYAQVASETDTSPTGATTETDYLYGLERIEQTRAGQGTYYHDDGLGSTRVLTDASGAVTDSYEYDDYGALQASTGSTNNEFMYAGEQFDSDANLYYNRARYLDVNVGRFTGLDPFGGEQTNPISLNKYAYASADPINGTDPSGLMTLEEEEAKDSIESTLRQGFGYIDKIGNYMDRVNTVKGFLDLIAMTDEIFGGLESGGLDPNKDNYKLPLNKNASYACLPGALKRGFEEGLEFGLINWAEGFIKDKGRKFTAFDIILPNMVGGIIPNKTGVTLAKIKFGREVIPIKVSFGLGTRTGIVGFGFWSKKNTSTGITQLWRADEGAAGSKHQLMGSEVVMPFNDPICIDPMYHFHVYKWGAQSRATE